MTAQQTLNALARDREHGASEITQRALEAYAQLAHQADDPAPSIADAGARLIHAHPAMAPLVNATDAALDALQDDGPQGIHRVIAHRRQRRRRLVDHASDQIPTSGLVATYSRSGTVLDALDHAYEQGNRYRVVLSEARPGSEGLPVARQLAREHRHVTVTYDAALPQLAADADLLLVGADTLCAAGIVNKAGTRAIALQARQAGTRILAAASLDKILPASYRGRPPLTASGNLGHDLPGNAHESAPLFECAPLDIVDGVVTEDGLKEPEQIHELVAEASLSRTLLDALRA